MPLDVEAQLGLQRREHVLPHGVARAGVIQADGLVHPGRLEGAQEFERPRADRLLGPPGSQAPPRGRTRRGRARRMTPRSWLPARHTAAWSRASSTQASGSAPYPTRSRGTTAPGSRRRRSPRAPPRGLEIAVDVGDDRDLHLYSLAGEPVLSSPQRRSPGSPPVLAAELAARLLAPASGRGPSPRIALEGALHGRRDRARPGVRAARSGRSDWPRTGPSWPCSRPPPAPAAAAGPRRDRPAGAAALAAGLAGWRSPAAGLPARRLARRRALAAGLVDPVVARLGRRSGQVDGARGRIRAAAAGPA